MKNAARVSVIMPVYNAESHLSSMLESVLDQEFEDFELIVIDDGSVDKSLEICRTFARTDPRMRVITQKNCGPSSARNRGLRESRSEYLVFFDADDLVEPSMLGNMVALAESESCDMVVCGLLTEIWEDGTAVVSFPTCSPDKVVYRNEAVRTYVISAFGGTLFYPLWNKLYRRKLITEHELAMPEGIDLGEDMLFNLDFLAHVEILGVMRECHYHYIQHGDGNLMSRYRENKPETLAKWISRMCSFAGGLYESSEVVRGMVDWLRVRWAYSCFVSVAGSEKTYKEKVRIIHTILDEWMLRSLRGTPGLCARDRCLSLIAKTGFAPLVYAAGRMIGLVQRKSKRIYLKGAAKSDG